MYICVAYNIRQLLRGHQAVRVDLRIKESKELRSCILESKESLRSLEVFES